ncbi:hypothetical protein BDQ12DRAFT_263035 [Crucibulum laeve]|uniref:Uncharacterized protein n=1 Tax=Crucibulum laeve TaxID=68775 RepID=A0A5C3LTX9_9AGAR|nr:hypothetical protein BDQ12DRAFT_263035 [Crucibulum laeve]
MAAPMLANHDAPSPPPPAHDNGRRDYFDLDYTAGSSAFGGAHGAYPYANINENGAVEGSGMGGGEGHGGAPVEGRFVEDVHGFGTSTNSSSTGQAAPRKRFKTPTMPAVKILGGMPYGRSSRSQDGHQQDGNTPTSSHSHSRSKSSGTHTLSSLSTLRSGESRGGSSSSGTATPLQPPAQPLPSSSAPGHGYVGQTNGKDPETAKKSTRSGSAPTKTSTGTGTGTESGSKKRHSSLPRAYARLLALSHNLNVPAANGGLDPSPTDSHPNHASKHKSDPLSIPTRKSDPTTTASLLLLTTERLAQETARANAAERQTQEVLGHLREAVEERRKVEAEARGVREELGLYKVQLDEAQKEIFRAQSIVDRVQQELHDAEDRARRDRDRARKVIQERAVEMAMEEGRREGYRLGLERGRILALGEARDEGWEGRGNDVWEDSREERPQEGRRGREADRYDRERDGGRREQDRERPERVHSTSRPQQPQQQQRHSPPDVAQHITPPPMPTLTTPMPLDVPSTQPQPLNRPPSASGHRPPSAMAQAQQPPSSMGQRPPSSTGHHPTSSTAQRPPRPRSIPNPEPVLSPEEIAIRQRSFSNLGGSSVNLNGSNVNFFSDAASTAAPQHGYDTHPLQTLRHTASRSSINLDDGPGNEIHPTIMHAQGRAPSPSIMSHRSVSRLPENFIPVMGADGTFTLPPPHEVGGPIMAAESTEGGGGTESVRGDPSGGGGPRVRDYAYEGSTRGRPGDGASLAGGGGAAQGMQNAQSTTGRRTRASSIASRGSTHISHYDLVSPPRPVDRERERQAMSRARSRSDAGTPTPMGGTGGRLRTGSGAGSSSGGGGGGSRTGSGPEQIAQEWRIANPDVRAGTPGASSMRRKGGSSYAGSTYGGRSGSALGVHPIEVR